MAAALTRMVATIPGQDLVAVVVVYHSMYVGDEEPDSLEVYGCSRRGREEIVKRQALPEGLVYVWSNLEFDVPAPMAGYPDLAAAWREVNDFAQVAYESIDPDDDEFDETWVPRSVLIAVCQRLNEGGWAPERPAQLAADAIIYPAARGGVDPDTADNVNAALNEEQRRRLDDAGLLLPY